MVPERPVKVTCTRIVWAVVSQVTTAVPIPIEIFGGFSLGPVRRALKFSVAAPAELTPKTSTAAIETARTDSRLTPGHL